MKKDSKLTNAQWRQTTKTFLYSTQQPKNAWYGHLPRAQGGYGINMREVNSLLNSRKQAALGNQSAADVWGAAMGTGTGDAEVDKAVIDTAFNAQLRRAEAKPIRQQWEALRQAQQSLHNLELQLTSQRSSQSDQQRQLQTSQQDLQHQDQALVDQRQALESLQAQARSNQERQQLAQHLLALDNLDREAQQLQAHKDQFSQLQQEAEQWKAELAALPAIGSEQVRALRQGEQRLAQAQALAAVMIADAQVMKK